MSTTLAPAAGPGASEDRTSAAPTTLDALAGPIGDPTTAPLAGGLRRAGAMAGLSFRTVGRRFGVGPEVTTRRFAFTRGPGPDSRRSGASLPPAFPFQLV